MCDLEYGQRRTWYKSRRSFIVDRPKDGTTHFVICKYDDGTEESHDYLVVDCKSFVENE